MKGKGDVVGPLGIFVGKKKKVVSVPVNTQIYGLPDSNRVLHFGHFSFLYLTLHCENKDFKPNLS